MLVTVRDKNFSHNGYLVQSHQIERKRSELKLEVNQVFVI